MKILRCYRGEQKNGGEIRKSTPAVLPPLILDESGTGVSKRQNYPRSFATCKTKRGDISAGAGQYDIKGKI
jgi:hypothetical protein